MGEEAVCKGLEVRENMVDSGNLLKLRLTGESSEMKSGT